MQQSEKLSKAESARINGAKSHGPASTAGKQRSSMNNLKHGIYSSRVVLDNENPEIYAQLNHFFNEMFQPLDLFESECVTNMVNARWLLRRLESAETAEINITLAETAESNAAKYAQFDARHEHAVAYHTNLDTLERMARLQDRCHRRFERSYRLLTLHRRKHNRAMPDLDDIQGAETAPPPPETPATLQNERDEPNSAAAPSIKSPLIIKIAAILVIFALLSLEPARTTGLLPFFSDLRSSAFIRGQLVPAKL